MRKLGLMFLLVTLLASSPGWSATKPPVRKPAPKTKAKALPRAPALAVKESAHFTLTSDLPPATMEALLKLCESTLDGYREVFGFSLYPNPQPGDKKIVVRAVKGQQMGVSTDWAKRPVEMRLTIPEMAGMGEPGQLMPWFYSQVAHAFAEPLGTFDEARFNDGFMDFLAAYVVDYVVGKNPPGGSAPVDYRQMVGSGQFARRGQVPQPGSQQAAASLLNRVSQASGKDTLAKALRLVGVPESPLQAPATKPIRVAALVQQLVDLTGEGEIQKWFQEQHFSTVLDPQNITARELWQLTDRNARCRLLCERWGASTTGLLDDSPVQVILQVASGEQAKTVAATPEGVKVKAADDRGVIAWYQPATKRIYVIGKVTVEPSGQTVQDDAIDEKGQALHLNAAPPAK